MASRPQAVDQSAYQGAEFQKIALNLIGDAKAEVKKATRHQSEISKIPFKVTGSKKHDLKYQATVVKSVLSSFETMVTAAKQGNPVSAPAMDKLFEKTAFEYVSLSLLNEKWDAIFGLNIIQKMSAFLTLMRSINKRWKESEVQVEKQLKELEKALKKAEREKWEADAKRYLGYAWEVFKATNPYLRSLSAIRKIGVDYVFDVSKDLLFGNPEKIIKDTIKNGLAAGEVATKAKGFNKIANVFKAAKDGLKKAGKTKTFAKSGKNLQKLSEIKASIEAAERRLIALNKLVSESESAALKARQELLTLARKAKAQLDKSKSADKLYLDHIKLRDRAL